MKNYRLSLMLFLGVLIGCATSYATQATLATAQPGPSGFTRCALYTWHGFDGDLEDLDDVAQPIGQWTPVGGDASGLILCR